MTANKNGIQLARWHSYHVQQYKYKERLRRHIKVSGFEETKYGEPQDSGSDHGTGHAQGHKRQENQ